MNLTEAKIESRKRARAAVKAIPEPSELELGARAAAVFCSQSGFDEADFILVFLSMPGEIHTEFLIRDCMAKGKRLAVPRIEGEDIAFVRLDEDYLSWPRDRLGIPEPPAASPALSFEELGAKRVLVAAPGLAFDRAGGRLGRGKGYYDRFLAAAHRAALRGGGGLSVCGFCYSVQVFDSLPTDARDVPVNAVATEAGLLSFHA